MNSGNTVWLDNQFQEHPLQKKLLYMNFLIFHTVIGALTVSVASKQNPQRPVEFSADDRRSVPSIEVYYCYSKVDDPDAVSTMLVAIDCQSKMLSSMPIPSKGFNLRGQTEYLVRCSMALNHMDKVEFVSDAEPSMKSLLASVRLLRQHWGYPTVTHPRPCDKGRTAQMERIIQAMRKQNSTLVHMASERYSLQLPGDHAIWPWSYLHATWLLNRFPNHTTTTTSPFELVFGWRYSGKIASFGEAALVLHRKGSNTKTRPQWSLECGLQRLMEMVYMWWPFQKASSEGRPFVGWLTLGDLFGSSWCRRSPTRTLPEGRHSRIWGLAHHLRPNQWWKSKTRLPEGAVGYDAKDVIDNAKAHLQSPASDTEVPVLDDAKLGQADQGFVPHKSARLDTADNLGESIALDHNELHEVEPRVPKGVLHGLLVNSLPHTMLETFNMFEMLEKWMMKTVSKRWLTFWNLTGSILEVMMVMQGTMWRRQTTWCQSSNAAAGYEEIFRLLEMKVIHEPSARDLEKGQSFQQGLSWTGASEIKSGNADVAMWHVNSEAGTKEWLLHLLQRQELVQD